MPIPKGWKRKKLLDYKRACAPGSVRTVKSGKARVLVCCPRGKRGARGRCKVGLRAVSVDTPLDGFAIEEGRSKTRGASHKTKQAAAVAYMRALDPDLNRGQPDAFVLTHWRKWQRQSGAKIVKTLDGLRVCKPFDPKALAKGARIEHREHPEFARSTARKIARDHLCANPKAYARER